MTDARGWIAVRNGDVYCAPLCGGGCKYDAFLRAIKDGDKLAVQCGKGYTRVVHENLGWHFHAVSSSGHMKVYRDGHRKYSALLGALGPGGAYIGRGTTAKTAIADALNNAIAHKDRLEGWIKGGQQ